ncbi:hypothetical protein [Frankia sp. R82]|uniref:hypothetical protein n=1 Tax=Frankia sp. R82 TaxID=2950553 RepID=UPI0020447065|nr:hypothetical protein [Frankia sp. R82]MCM3883968.1 hypothetical protein [Frankia sp. R82]
MLPAGWARGTLVTVTGLLTVVVALGDLASAWVVLALPVAVVAAVGYHEVLEQLVRPDPADIQTDQTEHGGQTNRSDRAGKNDQAGLSEAEAGHAEKPGADGTPA